MKIRHFFAFGICFFALGFTGRIYAQNNGVVDETAVEQTDEIHTEETQKDETEKRPNIFVRTANFFMNLPFGYDLGCEPTLHGSLTYFNLKYRWSDEKHIFSRLLFNYGTTLDINHDSFKDFPSKYVSKYEVESKAIDFKLIPWGKQVYFNNDKPAYFTIEPGVNVRMEYEKGDVSIRMEVPVQNNAGTLTNALLLYDISEKEDRYIIRPYYSASLFSPVGKPFSVTVDVLYAPLYFYWAKSYFNMKYNVYKDITDTASPPGEGRYSSSMADTLHYRGMSENYIDTNVVFGLFNFVALSGRFIYERKHKDEYDVNNNFQIEKKSEDNRYDLISLKIGGSLINIGKADLRIKTGVFYQWDWTYNHNHDKWDQDGKWIFGVGMRNLY